MPEPPSNRIHWLFVIARNSTFTYQGQAIDIKQVGRELRVRYILEGSVRKFYDFIDNPLFEAALTRGRLILMWAEVPMEILVEQKIIPPMGSLTPAD